MVNIYTRIATFSACNVLRSSKLRIPTLARMGYVYKPDEMTIGCCICPYEIQNLNADIDSILKQHNAVSSWCEFGEISKIPTVDDVLHLRDAADFGLSYYTDIPANG